MKARLLVLGAGLCLTAAFATPVSAASTTAHSHAAKASAPKIACNLNGCWTIHKKKTAHKGKTASSASKSATHHGTKPRG